MPVAPRARRKRVLAVVVGLVAALVVAELVCRIDAIFPGQAYSSDAMRGFLVERAAATSYGDVAAFAPKEGDDDPTENRTIPDPWTGWTSPNQLRAISRGTRWFDEGGHAETFDVVLIGGSFAAQLGNELSSDPNGWLASLPEVGARKVVLWNLALAAQKQPSPLDRFAWVLGLGWKPDLVLCVDGYNDVALSAENAAAAVHPAYPVSAFWAGMARAGDVDVRGLDLLVDLREAQRRVSARAKSGLALSVWRSALLSRAWSASMSRLQADFRAARETYASWLGTERSQIAVRGPVRALTGPEYALPGAIEPAGVVEGVRSWAEAARNLRAICDARRIPFVHALQPALDDEGSKPISDDERRLWTFEPRWRAAVKNGYPLLRAGVAELARDGVVVHDGSRVFAQRGETLYADWCHLNGRGYQLFGAAAREWIAGALVAR